MDWVGDVMVEETFEIMEGAMLGGVVEGGSATAKAESR